MAYTVAVGVAGIYIKNDLEKYNEVHYHNGLVLDKELNKYVNKEQPYNYFNIKKFIQDTYLDYLGSEYYLKVLKELYDKWEVKDTFDEFVKTAINDDKKTIMEKIDKEYTLFGLHSYPFQFFEYKDGVIIGYIQRWYDMDDLLEDGYQRNPHKEEYMWNIFNIMFPNKEIKMYNLKNWEIV